MSATSLLRTLNNQRKQSSDNTAAPHNSQQSVLKLLDALPQGIQKNDLSGKITYSNKAHHQLLGAKPNALIGRYIWDSHPDPNQQLELKNYLDFLIREQPVPTPYISRNNRHLNGQLLTFEIA